jgi:hypothetical protein
MRKRGWLVGQLAGLLAGLLVVLAFGVVASAPTAAWAQAKELTPKQRADKERREKKALTDFSAGKYQEAIDLMAELYADFQEPMYYRNIGRCYQKLGDPDRAIAAFEEFLAKAKDASPASVAETKDFIRQMQELKQKRTAEHAPPPPPPLTPGQGSTGAATATGNTTTTTTPTAGTGAGTTVAVGGGTTTGHDAGPAGTIIAPPPPPPPTAHGGGGRVAGWVLLGGGAVLAAAGGGVLYSSWAEYNNAKDNKHCPNTTPDCMTSADMVKSRNMIATVLLVSGALAAVVGGVVLVVSPSASSETASSRPDGFTVALRGRF